MTLNLLTMQLLAPFALALAPLSFGSERCTELPPAEKADLLASADSARHAAQETADGFQTRTPSQGWTTVYDSEGALTAPDHGGWSWGLELNGWGYEGSETRVGAAASVNADGGRVSLRWGEALTEWWQNDASGLEHGFTVHSSPVAEVRGAEHPLRFVLEAQGLRPKVAANDRSAYFVDETGAARVHYTGLIAFDAEGRDLDAWMEAEGSQLTLCVLDKDAVYPLTVDPIAQEAFIKASNPDSEDWFGSSIALSGNTLVVGAPGEDSGSAGVNGSQSSNARPNSGAAYVFVYDGGQWTQEAYLKAFNPEMNDGFGNAVAISGDTIAVGASGEDSSGTGVNSGAQNNNGVFNSGAVYVFTRSGANWTQEAYVKASHPSAAESFGMSVAIEGDTMVVATSSESSSGTGINMADPADESAPGTGAAFVFERVGSTWSQTDYIKASNAERGDFFGGSVAISGDTFVVGSIFEDGDDTLAQRFSGAAYVYARSGGTWVETGYLKASNVGGNDYFGGAVAISGSTIVVSAINEASSGTGVNSGMGMDDSAFQAGAVYVFEETLGSWQETAYIKASNAEDRDAFGVSVAIDGDTILVGARGESSVGAGVNSNEQSDNSLSNSGALYQFTKGMSSWEQRAYVKASNPDEFDSFGFRVALNGRLAVGSTSREDSGLAGVNSGGQADNGARDAGAVYAYVLDRVGTNYCAAVPNSTGDTGKIQAFGSTVASENDLRLSASLLPSGSFGFFITSPMTGFVMNPGGSSGNLCLSGQVGRYVGPGQIQNSGLEGMMSLTLDLAQHPTPTGFVPVQAGDTWHFSLWYRDTLGGQPTSNFTDGLSIDFL